MKFILPFLFIVVLASCGQESELITRIDEANGFEIGYPNGWDTTRLDERMVFMAVEKQSDSLDKYNEGFSVSVFPNEGKQLEQIVEDNIKMAQAYYGQMEIEEEGFSNANGVQAIRIKMDYDFIELPIINFVTFINGDKKLYTITQSVEKERVTEYQDLFETIIDSFKWVSES